MTTLNRISKNKSRIADSLTLIKQTMAHIQRGPNTVYQKKIGEEQV